MKLALFLLCSIALCGGTITSGTMTTPDQSIVLQFTGIDDSGQAISASIFSDEADLCSPIYQCATFQNGPTTAVTGFQIGTMVVRTATVNGVPYADRLVEGTISFSGEPSTDPFPVDWSIAISMYDTNNIAIYGPASLFDFTASGIGSGSGVGSHFSIDLVPEPATMSMLGIGALALITRRLFLHA